MKKVLDTVPLSYRGPNGTIEIGTATLYQDGVELSLEAKLEDLESIEAFNDISTLSISAYDKDGHNAYTRRFGHDRH